MKSLAGCIALGFLVCLGVWLSGCGGLDLTALKSAARMTCNGAREACALAESACAGGEALVSEDAP